MRPVAMIRPMVSLLWLLPAALAAEDCEPDTAPRPDIDRAVSLRALDEELSACVDAECMKAGRFVYGLAQVQGFVIDSNTRDVILIGHRDPQAPALHIDDFVVMLRHALHRYAPRKGNTILTTAPGVSIDPRPETLARLESLADGPGGVDSMTGRWPEFCAAPQDVRILGIPDSRAAQVMLDADYLMKRFVNGQADIELPGYSSLSDLSLEAAKRAALTGEDGPAIGGLTRFWFAAGTHTVSGDEDIRLLETSRVVLLDEAELLTRQGEIVAAAEDNPLARRFSCAFSRNYPAIASDPAFSIYAELAQVFRWTALARLMVEENAFAHADFRPDWLIDHYPLAEPDLPATLPGLSEIRLWPQPQDPEYGETGLRLVLPSCGGVTADFSGLASQVTVDGSGRLSQLREIVLFFRPAVAAPFWDLFL